jgi:hypothetical protein
VTSWWSPSSTALALGRSLEHLLELSRLLQARGVNLVVLPQGTDTSTAVGRMFFQILGAIAEFEHTLMSERSVDGLATARARERTGGQKPRLGPRQIKLRRQMYDETGADGNGKHGCEGRRRRSAGATCAGGSECDPPFPGASTAMLHATSAR